MGIGDRFKGLRKTSTSSVVRQHLTEEEAEARLAQLDALKARGSMTDIEYRHARERIEQGKD